MIDLKNKLQDNGLHAAVVTATGITVSESNAELVTLLDSLIAERAEQDFPGEELKTAVRDLLRSGGFKPAGRNKPASEYLAKAARDGRFPKITNIVDINNYISLKTGLPASLLDLDVVGSSAELRYGDKDESFVFNASGQEIDVEGLISVCRLQDGQSSPLGNPVKDSMEAKSTEATNSVVAVVYAPQDGYPAGQLEETAAEYAELLARFAGAAETSWTVV